MCVVRPTIMPAVLGKGRFKLVGNALDAIIDQAWKDQVAKDVHTSQFLGAEL